MCESSRDRKEGDRGGSFLTGWTIMPQRATDCSSVRTVVASRTDITNYRMGPVCMNISIKEEEQDKKEEE